MYKENYMIGLKLKDEENLPLYSLEKGIWKLVLIDLWAASSLSGVVFSNEHVLNLKLYK